MAERMTPQDFSKRLAQLTARAWSDDAFKKRLLNDPLSVANEYDIPVPPGTEIRIIEDTPTVRHFILPTKPPVEELSDDQLEQVAGGGCLTRCTGPSGPTWEEIIAPLAAGIQTCCF